MKRAILSASAILVGIGLTTPGFAGQPSVAQPDERTQAAEEAAYSNKLICKRKAPTGSHIPSSVCRTQAQIDAAHEAAKDLLRDESQLRSQTLPTNQQLPPQYQ